MGHDSPLCSCTGSWWWASSFCRPLPGTCASPLCPAVLSSPWHSSPLTVWLLPPCKWTPQFWAKQNSCSVELSQALQNSVKNKLDNHSVRTGMKVVEEGGFSLWMDEGIDARTRDALAFVKSNVASNNCTPSWVIPSIECKTQWNVFGEQKGNIFVVGTSCTPDKTPGVVNVTRFSQNTSDVHASVEVLQFFYPSTGVLNCTAFILTSETGGFAADWYIVCFLWKKVRNSITNHIATTCTIVQLFWVGRKQCFQISGNCTEIYIKSWYSFFLRISRVFFLTWKILETIAFFFRFLCVFSF